MPNKIGKLLLGAGVLVAAWWWWERRHPGPFSYGGRFILDLPRPIISREQLRQVLRPRSGERILEIGPGTGHYTIMLAESVGPAGTVEIVDIQQNYLDHVLRRSAGRGLGNVKPTRCDAQSLPYQDDSFDAAVLITVLGEIPDQHAALREVARVLKPDGRLVVGETIIDPDYVPIGALQRHARAAGLQFEGRQGPAPGYFARFAKPATVPNST